MDVNTISMDQAAAAEALRCYACGEAKTSTEMVSDGRLDGVTLFSGECLACKRSRNRRTYSPSRHRDHQLKSRYGITATSYALLLAIQAGRCAVCRQPPKNGRLHVDHDHVTGRVRGLLCARCNSAIDWAVEFYDKALAYLAPAPRGAR